ncbi:uncharacterized protein LOC126900858 [Daktulosphaira vitifoliae]|uniref:uncharacterized protein LOC126900858 n=1 Tax=Daktulosphaira vitifoliae TaxID=58002 RepID=UPI0021AA2177|nr:uncharacterized protein LOC126900858 [Daktulosphaira vitifoliae]
MSTQVQKILNKKTDSLSGIEEKCFNNLSSINIEEFSQDLTEELFPDVWFMEDYPVQVEIESSDKYSIIDCAQHPPWAMDMKLFGHESYVDSFVESMENNYILSGSHPWKNSCMEENLMELITQATWEDNVNSLVKSHLDSQQSENSNMEDSLMELIAQDTLDHIETLSVGTMIFTMKKEH